MICPEAVLTIVVVRVDSPYLDTFRYKISHEIEVSELFLNNLKPSAPKNIIIDARFVSRFLADKS